MTEAEKEMCRDAMRQAIETEREICARIAGSQIDPESDDWTSGWNAAGESIAKLIRGQK